MRYGLLGEKLSHSYSKIIHEQLADYTYDLIPLTREELDIFLKQKAFSALNVTIPYKETVIPYLDCMDSKAKSIGAVNTIVNYNGILKGFNTDYYGFKYMLDNNNIDVTDKKVVILGAGGASKAIKAVITDDNCREFLLVDISNAPGTITYDELYENHTDAQIIINASPVGMYPKIDASPVKDLSIFKNCEAVVDVIYNPKETMLYKQAKELGINAVTGLEMLVAQAKYAVEFFLDKKISDSVIPQICKNIDEN